MRRKGLLRTGLALMFIALVAWLAAAAPAGAAFPGRNGLIAFWGGDLQSNPQIYVMNPDGTGITDLSRSPGTFDALPRWSADGSKIVFSRFVGQPPLNLYRMNADGPANMRPRNGIPAMSIESPTVKSPNTSGTESWSMTEATAT